MVPQLPILAQYAFYLILCASATLAQHLTIRALSQLLLRYASPQFLSPIPPSRRNTPAPSTSGAATPTPGWTAGNSPVASFHASTPSQAAPGGLNGVASSHLSSNSHSHTHAPHLSASAMLSPPSPPGPNAISTALFVSSCMQLFPILMVVWRYDDAGGQLARGVSWAVGAQNVEALRILLGATYWSAGGIVAAGAVARWLAKRIILGAMGLGSAA
jgi:Arv1-like family